MSLGAFPNLFFSFSSPPNKLPYAENTRLFPPLNSLSILRKNLARISLKLGASRIQIIQYNNTPWKAPSLGRPQAADSRRFTQIKVRWCVGSQTGDQLSITSLWLVDHNWIQRVGFFRFRSFGCSCKPCTAFDASSATIEKAAGLSHRPLMVNG